MCCKVERNTQPLLTCSYIFVKALLSSAVLKPAYCRIVHGLCVYIDAYGPRTNGKTPGGVGSSTLSASCLVYNGFKTIPSGVSFNKLTGPLPFVSLSTTGTQLSGNSSSKFSGGFALDQAKKRFCVEVDAADSVTSHLLATNAGSRSYEKWFCHKFLTSLRFQRAKFFLFKIVSSQSIYTLLDSSQLHFGAVLRSLLHLMTKREKKKVRRRMGEIERREKKRLLEEDRQQRKSILYKYKLPYLESRLVPFSPISFPYISSPSIRTSTDGLEYTSPC